MFWTNDTVIHPSRETGAKLRAESAPDTEISNVVSVAFVPRDEPDGVLAKHKVQVFGLDLVTAECLHNLALLSESSRAEILPELKAAVQRQKEENGQ